MAADLPDILPLKPYLRETVWGGRRLGERFGKDLPPGVPIGESFEVSALSGQESVVAAGPLAGRGLGELLASHRSGLVGAAVTARYGADFPLLIKLIDAQDDLSIQVHPDDAYAQAEGLGRFGKTEAWYVLAADGGRLALGLRPGTDAGALRRAVTHGRVEDVVPYVSVQPHDVVFLPAGTVHALGRGVMVYEVQQASDLTFRLYDYGRPGRDGRPRQLHLDRGLAVTDFERSAPAPRPAAPPRPGGSVVVSAEAFTLTLHGAETRQLEAGDTCAAVTVIAGAGRFGEVCLETGRTALLPAGRRVEVAATAPGLRFLVARPGVSRPGVSRPGV